MKRREQPEISPALPLTYEANASYTPALTVNLLLIEAVAQVPAHLWHVPQWIVWQLPIAYLYWKLCEERAWTLRVVQAWNRRLKPDQR